MVKLNTRLRDIDYDFLRHCTAKVNILLNGHISYKGVTLKSIKYFVDADRSYSILHHHVAVLHDKYSKNKKFKEDMLVEIDTNLSDNAYDYFINNIMDSPQTILGYYANDYLAHYYNVQHSFFCNNDTYKEICDTSYDELEIDYFGEEDFNELKEYLKNTSNSEMYDTFSFIRLSSSIIDYYLSSEFSDYEVDDYKALNIRFNTNAYIFLSIIYLIYMGSLPKPSYLYALDDMFIEPSTNPKFKYDIIISVNTHDDFPDFYNYDLPLNTISTLKEVDAFISDYYFKIYK